MNIKRTLKRYTLARLGLGVLAGLLSACQTPRSEPVADLVLLNARVFTSAQPQWAEAMVVSNKTIRYVGDSKGAQKYVAKAKKVIDLKGVMLMPGINDAHLHPITGAMKTLYSCNFPFSASLNDIQNAITQCVQKSGDRVWIEGGRWDSSFFTNNAIDSPRAALDVVSGDKALFLRADSGHDAWLNSKALALAGITASSKDPEGGTIVRDANGQPNGLLLEKAAYAAAEKLPSYSEEQYLNGARELMRIANAFGVTGMKDASAEETDIRALAALANDTGLTAHMAAAITIGKSDWQDGVFNIDRLLSLRDQYSAEQLDNRYAKIFLDGVPTASRTAAMLADYLPIEQGGETHAGELHFNQQQLNQMLTKLDAAGFTVKIHTAGDRAVQVALNAIETARASNGDSGLRHELAHAGYIAGEDIQRFKTLNAVADFSPYLWHPSPIINSIHEALGPRGEYYWPTKDLLAADAPMLAGSDWPSAVESMTPWQGIEALVTRADPDGVQAGQLWPEQAVSLAQVLKLFTLDGAKALRLDEHTGSLEVGKRADFIVLENKLFEHDPSKISETKVLATVFGGKLVHASSESPFSN